MTSPDDESPDPRSPSAGSVPGEDEAPRHPQEAEDEAPRRSRRGRPIKKDRARPHSISLTPQDLRLARAACKARGIKGLSLTQLVRTLLHEEATGSVRAVHEHHLAREADLANIIRQQATEIEALRRAQGQAGNESNKGGGDFRAD
jgi:hypothetical protein